MKVFVLTHEYSDKSSFKVCGATDNHLVAWAWSNGNDENHAYIADTDQPVLDIWSELPEVNRK